jgi:cytochrome c oxidase assembly protein subunit 15
MRNWAIFSAKRLRLYAWASLVSEILIVVTGGAVRLTASGLGCPTWPKCTEDSFTTVPEMGIHGIIEFGNRTLTGVLLVIALLTLIAAARQPAGQRKPVITPSVALLLLIAAQAVLGGITVWTGLNPWIVGAHFVLSGIMISIASVLVWRVIKPTHQAIPYRVYQLSWPIAVFGWISVIVGVIVTGAGPHSGDAEAGRNGLDLELWQHLHSYPAYVFLLLALISLASLLRHDRSMPISKWRSQTKVLAILVAVGILQAIVGVLQSRLGVPAGLVALHMLGASLLISLVTFFWLSVRGKSTIEAKF